jgi:hypothetical protein
VAALSGFFTTESTESAEMERKQGFGS